MFKPTPLVILISSVLLTSLPAWGQSTGQNPLETNLDRATTLKILPSAGTSTTPTTNEAYLLGAGDVIKIDIFDVPEYSGNYAIQADGTLNLPFVGLVNLKGLTLNQASNVLSRALVPIVRHPIVTVNLSQARDPKISITGEVTRPGVYTLKAFTTLTAALQQAGGLTQSADLSKIQVRHPEARGTAGQEPLTTLNLKTLLQSGDLNQDLILQDGDQVFIPTASQVSLADSQALTSATFAPNPTQPLRIAVVGEVNRPGPYTLTGTGASSGATTAGAGGSSGSAPRVTNAIQIAGGITQQADVRQIQVQRLSAEGKPLTIALNFWDLLQKGDINQDLPLKDGDTIVVPTAKTLPPEEIVRLSSSSFSPAQITVNVVGEVKSPGAIQVVPNTPLNQAILAAGGLNTRASKNSIQLLRLNPDGTVSQQKINLDLSQGLNAQNNPPLRPNDTIVVGRKGIVQVGDAIGTAFGSLLSPFTGIFSFVRLFGL